MSEKKKKKNPEIEVEKIEKSLKVNLTDDELLAYGIQLADSQDEKQRFTDELTEIKSRFKSEIDAVDSKINNIASIIRSKYQYRTVACDKTLNFKKGTVTIVRTDTGEEIEVRDIYDSERQKEIPGTEGK